MKNILIISFYYPPFLNMRAIRASKISKYLLRCGWDVKVLSASEININMGLPVEIEEERIFRVPFKKRNFPSNFARRWKKLSFLRKIFNYQDRFLKWYLDALHFSRRIFEKEKISLILSLSPPYSSNILAFSLSKGFNVPWVAEFGDLWSENYYLKRIFPLSFFEKLFEKRIIRRACSLVSVSGILCERLKEVHGKEVFLFPHFFDEEDYNFKISPDENFTFLYTGHLYPYQNFEPFFSSLQSLKKEGFLKDIEVRFFSDNYFEIKEWLRSYSDLPISIYPQISYRESIKAQMKSSVLLYFCLKEPYKTLENPVKGKIFSYLGAKRPTLVVGEDEGGELLEKTGLGKICKNENELKETIKEWQNKFIKGESLAYTNSFDLDNYYSYKNRISDFSNFLVKFLRA